MLKIYADGSPKRIAYTIGDLSYTEEIPFSTNFEAEYKSIIGAFSCQDGKKW